MGRQNKELDDLYFTEFVLVEKEPKGHDILRYFVTHFYSERGSDSILCIGKFSQLAFESTKNPSIYEQHVPSLVIPVLLLTLLL